MSDPAQILLTRLRVATDAHGALAEFCRKAGLPRKTVENWLNGTTIPMTALGAIARGVGGEPWELLKPEGAEPTPTKSSLLGDIVVELVKLDETKLGGILALIRAAGRAPIKGKDLDRKGG